MAGERLSEPAVRRGEIWLAELDKRRPVVVLTRDPLGRLLHSVIVGPVTSTVRGLSTEVDLTEADGVRTRCVVNLDNLQLVSRARLVGRVGRATPETMRAVCAAVADAVDCAP
ncbi:MAG: type II toxin-antitoxin system PemK/MazF family toxin [Actinomycetota bacterium]|jgi:mRNA interferase MazF|nr:type II toxin-antitoxin system PemK/MazF family toxin [Actinomycetota bacterium]